MKRYIQKDGCVHMGKMRKGKKKKKERARTKEREEPEKLHTEALTFKDLF